MKRPTLKTKEKQKVGVPTVSQLKVLRMKLSAERRSNKVTYRTTSSVKHTKANQFTSVFTGIVRFTKISVRKL